MYVVLSADFKTLEFNKYKGSFCPRIHLAMYCRNMVTYIHDDKILLHCFQDSVSRAALSWYVNLERGRIRKLEVKEIMLPIISYQIFTISPTLPLKLSFYALHQITKANYSVVNPSGRVALDGDLAETISAKIDPDWSRLSADRRNRVGLTLPLIQVQSKFFTPVLSPYQTWVLMAIAKGSSVAIPRDYAIATSSVGRD
ncbi:hypothetical protein CR513_35578, partial [Mucuna pruriens]